MTGIRQVVVQVKKHVGDAELLTLCAAGHHVTEHHFTSQITEATHRGWDTQQ